MRISNFDDMIFVRTSNFGGYYRSRAGCRWDVGGEGALNLRFGSGRLFAMMRKRKKGDL